jgi:hypothetical protein
MSIYMYIDGDNSPKALSIEPAPAVGDVIKYWSGYYRVRERVFDVAARHILLYVTLVTPI